MKVDNTSLRFHLQSFFLNVREMPMIENLNEHWAYYELHYSGGICIVILTKHQAIEYQKKAHTYKNSTSDDVIFADWAAIHWARPLSQFKVTI